MCKDGCNHECEVCECELRRKRINKILLNMGKYDSHSIQYEILRRELVRELDEYDNE